MCNQYTAPDLSHWKMLLSDKPVDGPQTHAKRYSSLFAAEL